MSDPINPKVRIRGIRQTIPSGYVLGRTDIGNGPAQLIKLSALGQKLGAGNFIASNLTVTDGVTAISGTTKIKFTSGATVTANGAEADIAISAAGGLFGPILSAKPSQASTGLNTWLNQGTATETDSLMGMSFTAPSEGGSNRIRGLWKAAPIAPYLATGLFLPTALNLNGAYFIAFGWMDSVSGKLQTTLIGDTQFNHAEWTNANTISTFTNIISAPQMPHIWIQLHDDGTNITINFSYDGIIFSQLYTVAKASGFLGASGYNRIFVGLDGNSLQCGMTLASYID